MTANAPTLLLSM